MSLSRKLEESNKMKHYYEKESKKRTTTKREKEGVMEKKEWQRIGCQGRFFIGEKRRESIDRIVS